MREASVVVFLRLSSDGTPRVGLIERPLEQETKGKSRQGKKLVKMPI
jgi:hypothetical protein